MKNSNLAKVSMIALTGLFLSTTIVDSAEAKKRGKLFKNEVSTSKTVTGANGKSRTWTTDRSYNKETGEYGKTVTTPKGNTRTYTGTASNGTRSGTYTTSTGKSGSFEHTRTKNDDGSVSKSRSVTNQNGVTKTWTTDRSYNKETGEFSKTVTNPKGNTRTYTGTASNGTRSGTYTTSTGKSGSFESTRTKNEDGSYTKNQSVTNQDGKTRSRSVNFTKN